MDSIVMIKKVVLQKIRSNGNNLRKKYRKTDIEREVTVTKRRIKRKRVATKKTMITEDERSNIKEKVQVKNTDMKKRIEKEALKNTMKTKIIQSSLLPKEDPSLDAIIVKA